MLISNEDSGFMGTLNVFINSMDSLYDIQERSGRKLYNKVYGYTIYHAAPDKNKWLVGFSY